MNGKMTVLEMTQDILSSMESDEVNSISDTTESLQVAQEVKTTYYDLISTKKIPTNEGLIRLEALSDPSRPNYLKIPDNVKAVKWIQYETIENGYDDVIHKEIVYVCPEEFLRRTARWNSQEPYDTIMDFGGTFLRIRNNASPRFWTTFDNQYIVFDSINYGEDSTLQQSKSIAWGETIPDFNMADDFVPDLDTFLFPLLLSEAKKACFINFKQVSNANEERRSRRQAVAAQNDLWRANQRRPYNSTPDYGRRRR